MRIKCSIKYINICLLEMLETPISLWMHWLHTMHAINPISLFIDSVRFFSHTALQTLLIYPFVGCIRDGTSTCIQANRFIIIHGKTLLNLCSFTKVGSLNFISIGKWVFFSCFDVRLLLPFCCHYLFPVSCAAAAFFDYIFDPVVYVCVWNTRKCVYARTKSFGKKFSSAVFARAHKTAKLQIYDNTPV